MPAENVAFVLNLEELMTNIGPHVVEGTNGEEVEHID